MRTPIRLAALASGLLLAPLSLSAQAAGEQSVAVKGGGISVAGWQGKIDAKETAAGLKLTDAKFGKAGDVFTVATGPSVSYWHPANKASGDYMVKATFTEPKYMSINSHPHPYGLFIGGADLGTDKESYLYCAAYGNGTFIVRGFGPEPFQMNGRRGEANEAVAKAAGPGQPVKQEIAMTVKGGQVTCSINGKVVGTYAAADVVGAGKLKSTDGVYGMRFGHNTEVTVTGFSMGKP